MYAHKMYERYRKYIHSFIHMEPWAIAMMCATLLIGMGTCGACCHKRGKSYVRDKEDKLRDWALGRAKELVHMGAHGANKLLEDV
jgi:hypothetical protein